MIAEVKYGYSVIYDWVEMEKTLRPLLPFHQVRSFRTYPDSMNSDKITLLPG